jgi:hypothetical protein
MNGMLREVRLLTLQALSGTSGTPGVSSYFVAAANGMNGECRQDYRDRASVTNVTEGRMFNPSLPSTMEVAQ